MGPITRQADETPASVRVRDNQRRSRARQKEFVAWLQQKVQDYERRGVEATLEMQRAARVVAIENSRLRSLLARHGVSAEEVDAYLKSFGDDASRDSSATPITPVFDKRPASQPKSTLDTPPLLRPSQPPISPMLRTATGSPASHSSRLPSPPRPDAHVRSDFVSRMTSQSALGVLSPSPASTGKSGVDKLSVLADVSANGDCCGPLTVCSSGESSSRRANEEPYKLQTLGDNTKPVMGRTNPTVTPSAMEMSCSDAAQIIADMQGHGDNELVKAALGCEDGKECVIKKSTVFQILENS
jgi:hypothetical protein